MKTVTAGTIRRELRADRRARDRLRASRTTLVELFSRHRIKTLSRADDLVQAWFCGEPKDNNLSFTVTIGPNLIVVSGDVGDLTVYRPSDTGMLSWLKSAIRSPEYLLSKVPAGIERYEVTEGALRSWLASEVRYEREGEDDKSDRFWTLARIDEVLYLFDAGNGSDGITGYMADEGYQDAWECVRSMQEPNANVRRCLAALQCFVKLHDLCLTSPMLRVW